MVKRPRVRRRNKKVSKEGSSEVNRGRKDIIKKYYNWSWFNNKIRELTHQLRGMDYQFIIGVSRGGLVPAVALSHALKIPMGMISTSSYTEYAANIKVDVWGLTFPLGVNHIMAQHMKFLIVDDIYDSGNTCKAIQRHLELHGITNIKFVTMIEKEKDDKSWIVFPWE